MEVYLFVSTLVRRVYSLSRLTQFTSAVEGADRERSNQLSVQDVDCSAGE
jgi:hypothetical protein